MKETIQTILNAEKAAREQVEEARMKAKEIRLKAEQDAEGLSAQIREKSHSEISILLKNAEKAGEKEKTKLLRDQSSSKETQPALKEKQNEKIIDQLFRMVIGEDAVSE